MLKRINTCAKYWATFKRNIYIDEKVYYMEHIMIHYDFSSNCFSSLNISNIKFNEFDKNLNLGSIIILMFIQFFIIRYQIKSLVSKISVKFIKYISGTQKSLIVNLKICSFIFKSYHFAIILCRFIEYKFTINYDYYF